MAKEKNYKIALIGGDGTGPEVVAEAVKVVKSAAKKGGFTLSFKSFNYGGDRYLKTGETISDKEIDGLREFDAVLLGAIGHPKVAPGILEKGILLKTRFALDLYINLRPVKLFPGVETPLKDKGPKEIDYIVVRENTEGLYAGAGGVLKKGTQDEVAIQESINTRKGVERCIALLDHIDPGRTALERAIDRRLHDRDLVGVDQHAAAALPGLHPHAWHVGDDLAVTVGPDAAAGPTGAEAIELIIKLCRERARRAGKPNPVFVTFQNAFHGRTMGALSLTASKTIQKKHYYPVVPGITHIPYAYCYRCPYNLTYPQCGIECVRWVEETLFRTTMPPEARVRQANAWAPKAASAAANTTWGSMAPATTMTAARCRPTDRGPFPGSPLRSTLSSPAVLMPPVPCPWLPPGRRPDLPWGRSSPQTSNTLQR